MKNKFLTKELFIGIIDAIEVQTKKDWSNSEKLAQVFNCFVDPYDNSILVDQLLNVIYYNFGINPKEEKYGTDIEYYMCELDFGKKYTEGCYTIYDENVKLETAEDLWNLLTRPKKEPKISDDGEPFESCVMCGKKTNVLKSTHIDLRNGYYEGIGQVCNECISKTDYRVTYK